MLVKARVAENIDILHGGGDFKHYILLGCTIYEILRLLGLVEGMWELVGVADSATTLRAGVKGGKLSEILTSPDSHCQERCSWRRLWAKTVYWREGG